MQTDVEGRETVTMKVRLSGQQTEGRFRPRYAPLDGAGDQGAAGLVEPLCAACSFPAQTAFAPRSPVRKVKKPAAIAKITSKTLKALNVDLEPSSPSMMARPVGMPRRSGRRRRRGSGRR